MSVPPLTEALGIPGAHAVSLLDPDGPRVLWWAGGTAPTDQETAAAVTLAAAAAGLVLLGGDGADELGDVLLTSADAFHVVRLVDAAAPLVAHLILRRATANLAMARREFGSLLATYAARLPQPPDGPAVLPPAASDALPPAGLDALPPAGRDALPPVSADARPTAAPAALDPPAPGLPRRHRLDPPDTDDTSDLLDLLRRPYTTDLSTLDRVLAALRDL